MKKILVACGTGVVTSTTVMNRIEKILNDNGYKGKYRLKQARVGDAVALSKGYDLTIATTNEPPGLESEFISGIPFLTGQNMEPGIEKLLEIMEE